MNNPTVDTVWEAFDRVDVAGRPMAECRLCRHQIVPNRGTMRMHYRMKHCKAGDNSRQIDPSTSKLVCDKSRAIAPPTPVREKCTDRCSRAWQDFTDSCNENNNSAVESSDASDTCSSSSVASDSKLRRRYRTLNMLRYLAAGPADGAYAAIIENADDQIIRAIRDVGRVFIRGTFGHLSTVESLALGRYKESIKAFAGDASSTECTRRKLLKPRKARGRVPWSVEFVPMLLTLALARGGLETYVDGDGSDLSSFNSSYFEDSHDSCSDTSKDRDSSSNDASDHSDFSEDGSSKQSDQTDEESEQGEDGDDLQDDSDEDGEAEPENESESGAEPEETEEADDEEVQADPEESEEGDDEETESGSEESEGGDDEETESGSEESEEGDEEETESGSEESGDAETDESEELESEEPEGGDPEEEQNEGESEDEDYTDQQPTKNLKRSHGELSTMDLWVKRSRQH
jgi:hypothetical protein